MNQSLQYPILIPSLGRATTATTPKLLAADGVPFKLVVEEKESEEYIKSWGKDLVVSLPGSNYGSVVFARNFCIDYSSALGYARHWCLDDNIKQFFQLNRGKPNPVSARVVVSNAEAFISQFSNIGILGLAEVVFSRFSQKRFSLNRMVYCFVNILNSVPCRYRNCDGVEDVDFSLQVLSTAKYTTVLFYQFLILKARQQSMKGGNTDTVYQGDRRLRGLRTLQSFWPRMIEIQQRYGTPRHVLGHVWKKFDTPLLKTGQPD